MRRVRRLAAGWLILGALANGGCRDDVEPFQPQASETDLTGRLTLGLGDERSPAWSNAGDAIYYTTTGLAGIDSGPGVLVRLSLTDGRARAVLPTIQSPTILEDHWLAAPTPRPLGDDLAFVEITALWEPHQCDLALTALVCEPPRLPEEVERPPLQEIALRVRPADAAGALEDDPSLILSLAGVRIEFVPEPASVSILYPFQRLFARDSAYVFRASWGPTGDRLAVSDGLRILTWDVGAALPDTIPNTGDGVWPAWSPNGDWIAFTRLERADSTGIACRYIGMLGNDACLQARKEYIIGRQVLSIIRPDGSELVELDEGNEPAWAPDGETLYYVKDGRIWSISIAGNDPRPVPDTDAGREPAVSPDGRFLAFSRLEGENRNIWVAQLEQ